MVGDIHGCAGELERLIEWLPIRHGDRLIFLGDYVDRGPDSRAVVSFLLNVRSSADVETVFLKGNHEDMFLAYLGLAGNHGDVFLLNGGHATLASYGLAALAGRPLEVGERLPEGHLDFYLNLETYCQLDGYLCVHAGIQPLKRLDEQTEGDMLWIRSEFIRNPHPLPFIVLFGHTPQKEVFFDLPYKVGLDTGLVYGNKLSCLAVEEKVIYQIRRGAQSIDTVSVSDRWEIGAKKSKLRSS